MASMFQMIFFTRNCNLMNIQNVYFLITLLIFFNKMIQTEVKELSTFEKFILIKIFFNLSFSI